MTNDVSRAFFYAKVTRDIYIELPEEDPEYGTGKLGKLQLCLYGTRDAATNWQETLSNHLVSIGFKRGIGHPAMFYHKVREIHTMVHGDDYASCGSDESMVWLQSELEKA